MRDSNDGWSKPMSVRQLAGLGISRGMLKYLLDFSMVKAAHKYSRKTSWRLPMSDVTRVAIAQLKQALSSALRLSNHESGTSE